MAGRRPLADYPSSVGAQLHAVFPHVGPTSYTRVTAVPGTIPAVGGDRVLAAEAGLKQFDWLDNGVSDDNCWTVTGFQLSVSNPASGVLSGIPKTSYGLKWVCNVTAVIGGQAQVAGTEAAAGTNLSGICVRIAGIGPK